MAQPTTGGVGVVATRLVADQVTRGWDVVLACPPDGQLGARGAAAGARVLRWDTVRSPGPSAVPEARALARLVREVQPDLVHLHSSKAGLSGRLAVRGRVPTLFQPHNWSFEAVEGTTRRAAVAWERASARWADRVVCVSAAERDAGEAEGIRARWVVIPNGVDVAMFPAAGPDERRAARVALRLDPAGPLVVCVGRLSAAKGVDVLLDAWPAVTAAVPDAQLVVVGDGEERAALEPRVPAGAVLAGARDDVPRWLAAADVVAVPSRWEGMPLSVLEAMATGRSVVATDVGGTRECLVAGGGAIVAPEDPAALAAALAARLLDPALTAAEGAQGRARALAAHDLAHVHDAVAQLTEQVAAERRVPHRRRAAQPAPPVATSP